MPSTTPDQRHPRGAERGIDVDHVTIYWCAQRFTRCLSTPRGHAGTSQVTGGSGMRRTLGPPVGGSICTGRLTSSARSATN
jgi:hypothetical protein